MNQGGASEARLQPGYRPQTHNSSSGNPRALSKMTTVPRDKQNAMAEAIGARKAFFLVKVKMI